METLKGFVELSISDINAIISVRIENRKTFSEGVAWKEDELLKLTMMDFRAQSEIVSHSFIKLALLVNTSDSKTKNLNASIDQICEEIRPQLFTLLEIFKRAISSGMAECLFDAIARCIRSMFGTIHELLPAVITRNRAAINGLAGEIETIEKEHVKKLPLANKAAYRRHLLLKCHAIKDTIEEFTGYLTTSKEKLSLVAATDNKKEEGEEEVEGKEEAEDEGEVEGLVKSTEGKLKISDDNKVEDDENEEDDEMDLDDDAIEYDQEEIIIVEKALALIQLSLEIVKQTNLIMTTVADAIIQQFGNDPTRPEVIAVNCWIVKIIETGNEIEDISTNLGAELYPPLSIEGEEVGDEDDEDKDGIAWQQYYQQLKEKLLQTLHLLVVIEEAVAADSVDSKRYLQPSQLASIETIKLTLTTL